MKTALEVDLNHNPAMGYQKSAINEHQQFRKLHEGLFIADIKSPHRKITSFKENKSHSTLNM